MPILYGYSPAVIPPAPDWPPSVHVTGYWFPDPPASWAPPPELQAFLEAGPPPVYIGFGSMSSRDPQATARLALDALARTGQRGIILSGWGGMHQPDLPPAVLAIDGAPFSWLFPRVAAVVHHGGAGTTAAGLAAGVPAVVVPFFGDQPFWGRRVFELGAGPAPIPRKRLTVDNLSAALARAVADPAMRNQTARLGKTLQSEDGVARAVEVINETSLGRVVT
jgi:UDP:flavonoid glycosyltransferase YjiC (YdhE family)